jgi:hypothetical protein
VSLPGLPPTRAILFPTMALIHTLEILPAPKPDCSRVDSISSQPATLAIKLEGEQLGELGRDVCHRIFCSTQAASRAEQGADFAESFVCRAMHDGDE